MCYPDAVGFTQAGGALDAGRGSDDVYLDFSKAFDSVLHRKLLHKLSLFGIQWCLLRWFSDYLTTRTQRVLVDGGFASWSHVQSRVPQDSLLESFLFLLYVNDLPDVCSIALFADDAKCFRPISSPADHYGLQQDLNCLYDWTSVWGLYFNTKKCESMRISRKRVVKHLRLRSVPTHSATNPSQPCPHKRTSVSPLITLWRGARLQVFLVVAKANRMLGFLLRHCEL